VVFNSSEQLPQPRHSPSTPVRILESESASQLGLPPQLESASSLRKNLPRSQPLSSTTTSLLNHNLSPQLQPLSSTTTSFFLNHSLLPRPHLSFQIAPSPPLPSTTSSTYYDQVQVLARDFLPTTSATRQHHVIFGHLPMSHLLSIQHSYFSSIQ